MASALGLDFGSYAASAGSFPSPTRRRPLAALSSSFSMLSSSSSGYDRRRGGIVVRRMLSFVRASTDQPGPFEQDQVLDSKILPYCSIDKKEKKSIGELEQDFLQALQFGEWESSEHLTALTKLDRFYQANLVGLTDLVESDLYNYVNAEALLEFWLCFQAFYYEGKAVMSNEEFDNLKEELMWEGSSVVMLSADEQRFLEASMAYVAGKPIMSDEEFNSLKQKLKSESSDIVVEGPRCSLRSRKVYSDLTIDYLKMFVLYIPAAFVALSIFFFLDDLTGFEITYLLELPEPFSFLFTWFAAVPLIVWLSFALTRLIIKDFLILKGPCPNCGTENNSFFGTILTIKSGGKVNNVKCTNCGTELVYDKKERLITLPEGSNA